MLAGRRTPLPVTVTTRAMHGIPSRTRRATAAAVPTFWHTTPTRGGSPSCGTSRPVTAAISGPSAPRGNTAGSARTSTQSSPQTATAASSAAMACGLSSSTAIVARAAPQAASITRAPSTTSPARSRINASSQQIHGSHSAPFKSSRSTPTSRPVASFAAAGNAAPPRPAMPPASRRSIRAVPSSACQSRGAIPGSSSSRPSASITRQCPVPRGVGSTVISRKTPDTGECRSAEPPRPAATRVPTRTVAPGVTNGLASSPEPWSSATTAVRGGAATITGCSRGRDLWPSRRSPPRIAGRALTRSPMRSARSRPRRLPGR
jgi:hypothetical protein